MQLNFVIILSINVYAHWLRLKYSELRLQRAKARAHTYDDII